MKKILDLIREMGLWAALWYIADRALRALTNGAARIEHYRFVAQPVSGLPSTPARPGGKIEMRVLHGHDPLLTQLGRPPEAIDYRFRQRARCLAAVNGERLAGCIWFAASGYVEDEVRARYLLHPEHGAVWDFEMYVSPEWRGGVVLARLWSAARELLSAESKDWSISRVAAYKANVLAAHRRMHAEDLGQAIFLVMGPAQLMLASVAPFVHLSLNHRTAPALKLNAPHRE